MLDVLLDEWIICRAVVHPVAVPTRAMVLAVCIFGIQEGGRVGRKRKGQTEDRTRGATL